MTRPAALFESYAQDRFGASYRFDGLERVVSATTAAEVLPALAQIEAGVARGLHAAGFVAYEAASALNPALPARATVPGLPLLWFGLFRERVAVDVAGTYNLRPAVNVGERSVSVDETKHAQAVAAIHGAIARGESYQVNYTLRQRFKVEGDPFVLYRRLAAAQRAPFCAWLDTGRFRVLSASPELFFARRGERIVMRPMKGTARRAPQAATDRAVAQTLRADPKEQAENLMIVDLVRNDLGAVAQTGSVRVESLFEVERYPTVHQLTSTVSAQLKEGTSLTQILAALFPCGSVTGAPKRRTMELIRELEPEPRGLYCGAIGFVSPGDEAVFSVAIRTVVVDAEGNAELGLGSGVTWDARADFEYAECLAKGKFLDAQPQAFRLIEALRCQDGRYPLLERHLARLAASADYLGFRCDVAALSEALKAFALPLRDRHKVRLLLARDGSCELGSEAVVSGPRRPLRVALATTTVDSTDVLRYHKTDQRGLLDDARRRSGADEVLFVNERGELTEGSYHALVLRKGGRLLTPALACGLLPGVLRAELLEHGVIAEAVLTPDDLHRADGFWLINSVRGWRRGEMVEVAGIEPVSV
jgi:para-aminobenzoate synthetase/4-amino-4-deoxychorismate lyase